MSSPLFEIVTTKMGAVSIRNNLVNEIMHNPVGPWVEANGLYISQSQLKERLSENTQDELIVFDVGLGAAANALAALACADSLGEKCRPWRLVSFERDLDLLRFAMENADQFEHFSGRRPALQSLLDDGIFSAGSFTWHLRQGEFLQLIEHEEFKPHIIFYDPYSPQVNREMWSTSCFKKLYARCLHGDDLNSSTQLFTYSQATGIRVALLSAGFFVGYGISTGFKEQTTQASTVLKFLKKPLDEAWFKRWQRSGARYPLDCEPEFQAQVDASVEKYMLAQGILPQQPY